MPRVNVLVRALDGRTRCVECDLDDRDRSRDLARVVDAGESITERLGKPNASKAGVALLRRRRAAAAAT